MRIGADYTDHHELGSMEDVDSCCHSYHHCVESSPDLNDLDSENPKKSQYCDCDLNLHKCLRDLNTPESNDFGRVYFYMTDQCISNNYPIVRCDQYDSIFDGTDEQESRCMRYTLNTSKPKEYQFFNLPFYYNRYERQRFNANF